MLDDKDIKKLKEVFATKEDLQQTFVTKDEFEGFMEIATTKDDIKDVKKDIGTITDILGKMDKKLDEMNGLNKEVEYIRNTLDISAMKK